MDQQKQNNKIEEIKRKGKRATLLPFQIISNTFKRIKKSKELPKQKKIKEEIKQKKFKVSKFKYNILQIRTFLVSYVQYYRSLIKQFFIIILSGKGFTFLCIIVISGILVWHLIFTRDFKLALITVIAALVYFLANHFSDK
jgi:cytochrome b subunit of formate dehydrogenase